MNRDRQRLQLASPTNRRDPCAVKHETPRTRKEPSHDGRIRHEYRGCAPAISTTNMLESTYLQLSWSRHRRRQEVRQADELRRSPLKRLRAAEQGDLLMLKDRTRRRLDRRRGSGTRVVPHSRQDRSSCLGDLTVAILAAES